MFKNTKKYTIQPFGTNTDETYVPTNDQYRYQNERMRYADRNYGQRRFPQIAQNQIQQVPLQYHHMENANVQYSQMNYENHFRNTEERFYDDIERRYRRPDYVPHQYPYQFWCTLFL